MKDIKLLFTALLLALFTFASCDEKEETGDFDNWKERNAQYIDSIAGVARANTDGLWKIVLAEGLDSSREWPVGCYVYCKVLTEGSGTAHPAFTDSVAVNYSGRLIPSVNYPKGYIFDSSYDGELDPDFDVPVTFALNGTVPGFYTAVQKMTEGDTWRVYVPYELGYGTEDGAAIPGYSTLIFDINLVSFHAVGTTPEK